MFLVSRIKRVGKIKKSLKNLTSKQYILLSDGHMVDKNDKYEIIYREIKYNANKLNKVSDEELIIMLNEIDEIILLNSIDKGRIKFLKATALKIKLTMLNRINKAVKMGIKLVNVSNILIDENNFDEIPYIEILNTKKQLEYYLEVIKQDEKIQALVAELGFILTKNKGAKQYEKTRVSI